MTRNVNVLIIATLYVGANGLRCFRCKDMSEGPCFDPFDKNASSVVTCLDTHTNHSSIAEHHQCFYLDATRLDTKETIILRDCAASNYTCSDVNVDGVGVVSCRTCSEDLCNAGGKLEVGFWGLVLTVYLIIRWKIKT